MYENHMWEPRIKKWTRKRSNGEYYLGSSENKAWKFQAIRDLNLSTLAFHIYICIVITQVSMTKTRNGYTFKYEF